MFNTSYLSTIINIVRFHRTENLRGDLCTELYALAFETMIKQKMYFKGILGLGDCCVMLVDFYVMLDEFR